MIVLTIFSYFVLFAFSAALANLVYQYALMKRAGLNASLVDLIELRHKNYKAYKIIKKLIEAKNAGYELGIGELKVFHRKDLDYSKVIDAMLLAKRNGMTISIGKASFASRQGKNVVEMVQTLSSELANDPDK